MAHPWCPLIPPLGLHPRKVLMLPPYHNLVIQSCVHYCDTAPAPHELAPLCPLTRMPSRMSSTCIRNAPRPPERPAPPPLVLLPGFEERRMRPSSFDADAPCAPWLTLPLCSGTPLAPTPRVAWDVWAPPMLDVRLWSLLRRRKKSRSSSYSTSLHRWLGCPPKRPHQGERGGQNSYRGRAPALRAFS